MGSDLSPKMRSAIGQFGSCRRCYASRFAMHEHKHKMSTNAFSARPKLLLVSVERPFAAALFFSTFLGPVLRV